MKYIFGLISYSVIQFLYCFWEWRFMKYSFKEYIYDVEHYYDDINLY